MTMVNPITEYMDIWTSAQVPKKTNGGRGRSSNGNGQGIYGIKKLRELILELAVRGKLVPQDPSDEPASVLLEKIAEEKKRLVKEGKIKKQKALPEVGEDERPFDLPIGWQWVRFDKLIDPKYPLSYGVLVPGPNVDGGVPFVRIGDLDIAKPPLHPEKSIDSSIDKKYERTRLLGGELLMGVVGSIGKLGIVPASWKGANIARAICRIATSPHISKQYMVRLLQSDFMQNMFLGDTRTLAQPTLNIGLIKNATTPFPPLAEQHRIVVKVDEIMALCDQLEQQQIASNETHQTLVETLLTTLTSAADPKEFADTWQRIADHFDILFTTEQSIDQLKQTILQLAVMGKLVPQDPNDEPADKLLHRLKNKRELLLKEGKIQRAKFKQSINDSDLPYKLPSSWCWTRLSFISEVIDPNPSHRMPKYVDSGIPFISTENFSDDDKIDFSIGKMVTESTLEEQKKRFNLRDGSFALSRIGTIGKTRLLPLERIYCMSHALCVISPFDKELNTDYLRLIVTTDSVMDQAHAGTKSIGVPDLGMGVIRSFLIPLPPIKEQQRIVAKVNELMTICDNLKAFLNEKQTIQVQLADAIVEKAVAVQ